MADCVQCSAPVRPRQEALECDNCKRWQHRTCNTGITREQYREAVKDSLDIPFQCNECKENETQDDDNNASIVIERPFEIPEPVLEESIEDDPIGEIDVENATTEYHVVENGTNRGKRKLVDTNGFSYTLKKQKNDHVLWRCSKRQKSSNCPATIIQDGNTFQPGSKQHIHPAEPGCATAVKLKSEVKQRSKQSIFTKSAPAIVEEVMRQYIDPSAPEPSRPNPLYLTRVCNRLRQQERPKDPVNLHQEVDTDFIEGHSPDFFRKDLTVGDRRHLIFSTDRQIQLLSKAKTWYMDGTFRVVNHPWTQLFSIHAFIKSGDFWKQIPLVFCIMSGKRKEDYYEVLRAIDHLLPDEISLQDFVADFESGLWLALRERFPRFPIQGCAFHWAQAVFRKVQEHGLQAAYNQRDSIYKYLRQIMALPFLPPEHIPDMFETLRGRANSPELSAIIDYVDRTWIQSSVFKVDQWSIFMCSVRTNNDVEGWHNRLNNKLNTRGPVPFYLLVLELFAEAEDIPTQLKMVSEGKLSRYQRKKTRQVQGKIFSTWDRYCNREITASQLLRICASVYGPSSE